MNARARNRAKYVERIIVMDFYVNGMLIAET